MSLRRPLLWMTVCFLGGVSAGELAFYFPLTVALLAAGSSVAVLALTRPTRWLIGGALIVLLGAGLSHHRLAELRQPSLTPWFDRGPIEWTGQVAGFPRRDDDRVTAVVTLLPGTTPSSPAHGRVRLTIRDVKSAGFTTGPPSIRPGDRMRLGAALHPPRGLQNPGLFDSGWYARRQGIEAVASVRSDRITLLAPSDGLLDRGLRRVDRWRERIGLGMEASLSPEAAAVLKAMIIGHAEGLTPGLRERFAAAGVAHLLSISGSHLAMLAGVIFLAVRAVCRLLPDRWLLWMTRWLMPTQAAVLAAIPAAAGYTLLAGGQVATVRSLLMLWLYAGALLLGRPHDLLTALAVAALAVLLVDPLAAGMISFQLSYGAVLGMAIVLLRWQERDRAKEADELPEAPVDEPAAPWWRPWARRAQLYLWLTVAATIVTAPLTAHYFYQLNWVGMISNLVVPLVATLVIPLALLSAVISLAWTTQVFPLAALNEWLAGGLLAIVEWFADWPWAMAHLPSPSLLTLAVIYLGLAALWWRRQRWLRRVAVGAVIGWALIALAGLARPAERLRVAFLDVGQGDAAIVRFPDDRLMLIDGGPRYGDYDTGRAVVAPYLWNHGDRHVDYLVATHPQADHIGGQTSVLEKFSIGEVWHNGVNKSGVLAARWRSALSANGARQETVRAASEPIRIGGVAIDRLHPSAEFVDRHPALTARGENDLALVLRLRYGEHQFLFTGDIEQAAERELVRAAAGRLPATVLKVAHHGSRTSSAPEFLSAVGPREAVVSVGARNPYRHPAPDVVARYDAAGIALLRTDQDGQVLYISDGETLVRLTARELALQPVMWGAWAEEWDNYRRLVTRWWWKV